MADQVQAAAHWDAVCAQGMRRGAGSRNTRTCRFACSARPGSRPADAVAVFGCFATDGPQHCSGLAVARYSPAQLARQLGTRWLLISQDRDEHITPAGTIQPFTWVALQRQS